MTITWIHNTKTASFINAESSWYTPRVGQEKKTWGIKNIQVNVTQSCFRNKQDNACKCLTKLQ